MSQPLMKHSSFNTTLAVTHGTSEVTKETIGLLEQSVQSQFLRETRRLPDTSRSSGMMTELQLSCLSMPQARNLQNRDGSVQGNQDNCVCQPMILLDFIWCLWIGKSSTFVRVMDQDSLVWSNWVLERSTVGRLFQIPFWSSMSTVKLIIRRLTSCPPSTAVCFECLQMASTCQLLMEIVSLPTLHLLQEDSSFFLNWEVELLLPYDF